MKCIAAVVAGLSLAFVGTSASFAATINVPGDYSSIQAAIDASSDGDIISIAAGTYYESNINTLGKAITIHGAIKSEGRRSHHHSLATTIDADDGNLKRAIKIKTGEGSGTVIKDLVIRGGGMDDSVAFGGGIYCEHTSPTITGCWIKHNRATDQGGGIYLNHSDAEIHYCLIDDNWSGTKGGGIWMRDSSPYIHECGIEWNSAEWNGGGIYADTTSHPHLWRCYIRHNSPDGAFSVEPSLRGGSGTLIQLEDSQVCGNGDGTNAVQVSGMVHHVGENHVDADCFDQGDLDDDGDVDTDDLEALHDALGILRTDTNNNGCVDIDDLINVIEDWGEGCTP